MPAKGEPLTAAQIDTLRRWIEAGAPWPGRPALPPGAEAGTAVHEGHDAGPPDDDDAQVPDGTITPALEGTSGDDPADASADDEPPTSPDPAALLEGLEPPALPAEEAEAPAADPPPAPPAPSDEASDPRSADAASGTPGDESAIVARDASGRPPVRPPLPALPGDTPAGWDADPVDAFVLRQFVAAGLSPSPPAEPSALLARLYHDLLDRAPTSLEWQAFLDDPRPDAYERVVDDLLGRPEHAEQLRIALAPRGSATAGTVVPQVPLEEGLARNDPFDALVVELLAGDLRRGEALTDVRCELEALRLELQDPPAEVEEAGQAWEAEQQAAFGLRWERLHPSWAASRGGATLTVQPDDSILASGRVADDDTYEITAFTKGHRLTEVLLEALPDVELPGGGPGRGPDGGFRLTDLEIETVPLDPAVPPQLVPLAGAWSDAGAPGAEAVLDGDPTTGWEVPGADGTPVRHLALFATAQPFGFADGTGLRLRLRFAGPVRGRDLGRFRLRLGGSKDQLDELVAHGPRVPLEIVASLQAVAELPEGAAERRVHEARLQRHHREVLWDQGRELAHRIASLEAEEARLADEREAWLARRAGDEDLGEALLCLSLPPGVDEGADRLTRARALVSPDHPMSARRVVDHLWSLLFGSGLLGSTESTSTRASDPALLDWLAVELVESGWDLSHVLRLLATSRAYRQQATSPNGNGGLRPPTATGEPIR
jgi:hypothetical protein